MLLVSLSDPDYLTDLMVFLRNTGIDAITRSDAYLQIGGVEEESLARILDTWQGLHPGVTATIVRAEA